MLSASVETPRDSLDTVTTLIVDSHLAQWVTLSLSWSLELRAPARPPAPAPSRPRRLALAHHP
eukprot:6113356-Amphidinium_carterae.4